MAARARKHNESFKRYRENLKKEDADLKFRLSDRAAKFRKQVKPNPGMPSLSRKMRAIDGTMYGPFRSRSGE